MKPINEFGLSGQDLVHLKSALDEAAIVAITDKRGVITYVNKKFCDISKYSSEDLIGQTHRIINSQTHSPEFFKEMWQTISSGQVWEGEICNRAKDGRLYWVHTTIVPFMDENGKPERYVAVRYEITERKLAEEQLKIYAKKLEMSNRELQDFAFVAAHDLQEPLRKIFTFSDRIKEKMKSSATAETMDFLERIQNASSRMKRLINDLLAYSRVTTKAQPFVRVSLRQVLDQVISDLEIRIQESDAQIKIGELPEIEADPLQMQQLFLNLVGNALKFTRPNVPPIVEISARILESSPVAQFGQACEIMVTDNGIGFDEKYLDRIFTIFQRLHGRHQYEGTGIGLTLCRKIVDRHGGQITARAKLGEGASFIVTLPCAQTHRGDVL